jgi:hypothetical protein
MGNCWLTEGSESMVFVLPVENAQAKTRWKGHRGPLIFKLNNKN